MKRLSDKTDLQAEGLTEEQAAAAADDSPTILCIACAGSGKSLTLAYRIARLLSLGTPAASIVAITFTEKAADSIKRRVSKVLAQTGQSVNLIGQMYIGTIHAFCKNVLGDADAVFRQYDVLDANRFTLYLMSRYYELGIAELRDRCNDKYFSTLKEVRNAWNIYRDEGLSLADIEVRDAEVGVTLGAIERCLQRDQFIDFASIVRETADRARTDDRVRQRLATISHLLIDEYQDVSGAQEELISVVRELGAHIFVVGDDDQSIYGWRGAHISNILQFTDRYPGASEHVLATNFRSTRAIVAASNNFIAAQLGPQRLHKEPHENQDCGPRHLGVHYFECREDEAQWVADRIMQLLGTTYEKDGEVRGLTPGDFAILMRSTKEPEQDDNPRHAAFTRALDARGVRYTLNAGGSVFDRPAVAALRQTFIALQESALTRPQALQLIDTYIRPAFLRVDVNKTYQVLSDWGRRIHAPTGLGTVRQRLFPQELLGDLLEAFDVAGSALEDDVMRDIGLFSRMLQDVEGVYLSIDSGNRFTSVVRFLERVAPEGYDVTTEDIVSRPDAVMVSTVHQVKGLEFPAVFVVDVVPGRFPGKRSSYRGILPPELIQPAVQRGAYANTREAEARLFYTALTRAERYLYVSGAKYLPEGKRANKQSEFAAALRDVELVKDRTDSPLGLTQSPQRQRYDEATLPTSFSDVKYYLRCPMDYRFRKGYGFSPPVPELFGYGRVVHVAIEKLHERFATSAPTATQASAVAEENFHLKHIAPSRDPETRPGAYEYAKENAKKIAAAYAIKFAGDFVHQKQVEVRFEIPAQGCLITGSIDLLMRHDEHGKIVEAHVIDFKTMEGGREPESNADLDWRELSLQVQLYAKAAREVLGENAATGSIHLLKDNRRVDVPIDSNAVSSAIHNVEWAVQGILSKDYPMRPSQEKCLKCDFKRLCPKIQQPFREGAGTPPPIYTPLGPLMAFAI
ncbi:DNA helicase UvrD [Burkholderia ubonensis]|uniref:ATP-dependent helicase n=1 Tax=Burkholderia ubonensis TaxID=101571 RepID=UPI0007538C10|nr:ATP-dependent DNA helicase [Burkholderia ubonensis]KVO03213.1 DNA helicase UvrD [Burkholderia ubonensis]KVO19307.1 DNA helicase UvrD [Burkholderia ubonensis]KWB86013.1 DNA helicase UvrD [Burkholderia ubonensis]